MRLRELKAVVPVATLLLPAAWLQAKEPIVATDLLRIQRVTEVEVAPSGSFAIYGVQSIHTEPAKGDAGGDPTYAYQAHLWMVRLKDTSALPVQLTFGERNDTQFQISPDGNELAFVRVDRSQSKPKPQVWILPLGSPGEARQVTHLEFGAASPRWRPDGKALLVASSLPFSKLPGKPPFSLERPERDWPEFIQPTEAEKTSGSDAKKAPLTPDADLAGIRRWLDHNAGKQDPSDITRLAFLGELSLSEEMEVSELFRIDLPSTSEAEAKSTQLTKTFYPHSEAVYSPDGLRILFSLRPPSTTHPDRDRRASTIWTLNADGTDERPLLTNASYSFTTPQFAPDGKHLVLLGDQNDQPTYRQTMLAICDVDGTHLTWLTKDGDPSVQQPRIAKSGDVYFVRPFQGGARLERLNLQSREDSTLVDGPVGVSALGLGGNQVVYALISVPDPNELYALESEKTPSRQLTHLNTSWLANKDLSLPEEHWITRPDGTRVQYWVMKPVHAEAGKKYPWVLDMHGGPSAMWGPGEFSMWHEFQILCSFGYGVVYANPRGSSGYGYAFQRANFKNWGEGPMGDVLSALDDAEVHEPLIDRNRLFLTGGSYAGYLTAWIIGHDNRFRAAAAQRGVYDLSTFFGEANAYILVPEEFGGYPWDPETRRLLDQQSPITYVANIRTPFLIIHGSQDNRTGVAQSEMMFRALKQLNRPVEYIRYPGAGHELTRSGEPRQRMDHMLRIIEFFERYSENTRPAPIPSSTQ
jgi:dipeptidyl aminopeptidase/acylaminoacyl peptidase